MDLLKPFRRKEKEGTTFKLKPVPQMPDVYTIGVVEKVCACLDLDVDLVLTGDIQLEDIQLPPLDQGQLFLQTVLANGGKYNVRDWSPAVYKGVIQAILANFFFRLAVNY